jgi:hypothetical protein
MDIDSDLSALEPAVATSEPSEPGTRSAEPSRTEDSPTHIEWSCPHEDLAALRKVAARRQGGNLDEVSLHEERHPYGLPCTARSSDATTL